MTSPEVAQNTLDFFLKYFIFIYPDGFWVKTKAMGILGNLETVKLYMLFM